MKKGKWPRAWLTIFSLFASSCSHVSVLDGGPSVTGCVVDLKAGGFQCASPDKSAFFLSFADAAALECMSPVDVEHFLKACKKDQILEVMICTITSKVVSCSDPAGTKSSPAIQAMDNYFCLSVKDRQRVIERCSPS